MIRATNWIEKHTIYTCFTLIGLFGCTSFIAFAADIDKSKAYNQVIELEVDTIPSGFFAPIQGKVISPFGYRGSHFHAGTDVKLKHGDTVRAAFDGYVTKACRYSGYGNLVILRHPNSLETYYSHLSKCIVQLGDSVKAGQVVGLGGRTGRATTDHLHFEVHFNNVAKNPEKYFDFKNCMVKDAMKEKMVAYSLVIKSEPSKLASKDTVLAVNHASTSINAVEEDRPLIDNCVVIRKGDTLYSLSRRYGTTVKQLQELNKLENANLKLGFKLKVK